MNFIKNQKKIWCIHLSYQKLSKIILLLYKKNYLFKNWLKCRMKFLKRQKYFIKNWLKCRMKFLETEIFYQKLVEMSDKIPRNRNILSKIGWNVGWNFSKPKYFIKNWLKCRMKFLETEIFYQKLVEMSDEISRNRNILSKIGWNVGWNFSKPKYFIKNWLKCRMKFLETKIFYQKLVEMSDEISRNRNILSKIGWNVGWNFSKPKYFIKNWLKCRMKFLETEIFYQKLVEMSDEISRNRNILSKIGWNVGWNFSKPKYFIKNGLKCRMKFLETEIFDQFEWKLHSSFLYNMA